MNPEWTISLGATADRVARQYGISRADQDAFALQSQQRAAAALARGVFVDEIVAVQVPRRKGEPVCFAVDEHPRPTITAEKLARLGPAFGAEGTVTAASSSGINDGAAALVIAGSEAVPGRRPLARIIGCAVAGVSPEVMGLGPIPATRRVLERTGIALEQIELIELNEAFAAQSLACIQELSLDPARVNIYGGAIALGHPLGCTGAKILVTLVHALRREDKRLGLATMCIGVGQGIAMIIERVE
jgi:acetyl-CoA C-acetyltransferase/3-oxo-5,6-didehydrosuberyl-CoA/3-oxoadipyl-CoA thiolase